MQKNIVFIAIVSLLFVGCAPQPDVILEPIEQSSNNASKPAPKQNASLKNSHESLILALKKYYISNTLDSKEIDSLLSGGVANIDAFDENGESALMIAIRSNDYEMVSKLASAGANADAKTTQEIPLITLAVQEGNLESAKALIANGADVNANGADAPSPLTITTLGGITSKAYQDMSALLLDNRADANFGKIGEHSLLIYAIKTSQEDIAIKMIENGADIESSDENGLNALSWAILLNQEKTVDLLLEKQANGDARDVYGYSPLAWAVFVDNQKAVTALTKRGFEVNENDRGWMAAEISKSKTLNELRALLGGTIPVYSSHDESIIRFKDMDFLQISYEANTINFITNDTPIKDFILAKPNRLIVDFKRDIGVKNITTPIKDKVFKKVTVGRHLGWYRVVVELDRSYKYTINRSNGTLKVTLK